MNSRVAVVILNYNGASMLRRFLPSVVANSPMADIVVADNASTDDSVAVLKGEFPNIRVITLERNYGFAEGYNRALREVDSEYYILLNSDVEVTDGWIEPLLEYMGANENVGACQPKVRSYNNKDYFEYAGAAGGFIDYYGYPYCRGRLFDTVERDNGQYDTAAEIFWATGAALMIRRDDFWNSGAFDAGFFAHMEEIDLCWRLKAMGRSIVCVPASVVYHVGGATLSKSNPRKTFLNFRNNLLMLHKNLPQREYKKVMRVRSLLDYIAAVKFLLTGAFGDFKAVVAARREFNSIKNEYDTKRRENIDSAKIGKTACRASFSILVQYYIKRKRLFAELPDACK